MTLNELLEKANKELKYYEIQYGDDKPIMCEDGEYRVRPGYAVVNLLSDVREHTTTLLPGAIFQSQHLDATLHGLLNPVSEEAHPALAEMPVEDVMAN